MRIVALLLLLLSFSSMAFAAEVITSIVGNSGLAQKAQVDNYLSGDLWLRLDKLEKVKADIDLQFTKDKGKVNVAQVKFLLPGTDVVVGRQQMGWGVGYTVNPVDIINPLPIGAAFDPTFVRDGRDAVKVVTYFDPYSKLELVCACKFEEEKDLGGGVKMVEDFNSDLGVKIKSRFFEWDAAAIYIEKGQRNFSGMVEAKDKVVGVELVGSLPWEWGAWCEAARYLDSKINEGVVGTDYYFGESRVIFEYYRNGFGAQDMELYDPTLQLRGRLMGRDYFIPSFMHTVNEKLTLTAFDLYNLNDGSMVLGGVYDYFFNDNLEFILMPYLLMGDASSEYGQQKAALGTYALEAKLKWVF